MPNPLPPDSTSLPISKLSIVALVVSLASSTALGCLLTQERAARLRSEVKQEELGAQLGELRRQERAAQAQVTAMEPRLKRVEDFYQPPIPDARLAERVTALESALSAKGELGGKVVNLELMVSPKGALGGTVEILDRSVSKGKLVSRVENLEKPTPLKDDLSKLNKRISDLELNVSLVGALGKKVESIRQLAESERTRLTKYLADQ